MQNMARGLCVTEFSVESKTVSLSCSMINELLPMKEHVQAPFVRIQQSVVYVMKCSSESFSEQ